MSEYKCINCGETKQSTAPCKCNVCGYNMFKTPYDRRSVLADEIRKQLLSLEFHNISDFNFEYYRIENNNSDKAKKIYKASDDNRFPSFAKIHDYICSAKKTEEFYSRFLKSIQQIRSYLNTEYRQKYTVSFDKIENEINICNRAFNKAISSIGTELNVETTDFPQTKLLYTESLCADYADTVNEILNQSEKLLKNIYSFIRINNIYGNAYKEKISVQLKKSSNSDIITNLEACLSELKKEVETKYIIDIFSDGTDELKKMLRPLLRALKTVLTISVVDKKSTYFVCGTELKYNEFVQAIINKIKNTYAPINGIINSPDFLSELTDNDLFSLYTEICHNNEDGFSTLTGVNKIGENEQKLNALIGLNGIKESIKKIKAYALSNKDSGELNIHMCFLGNPGSGKTEVARIIAGILYENKILPTYKMVETDRSGLIGQYVGETPQKTMDKIQEAMGGVLFIDEAYSLVASDSPWDYGHEAVSTLIKAMEDFRGKFCVILAGYKNEMLNMISSNPGFKSRIQFTLDFPNYSRQELENIAKLMLEKRKYTTDEYALNRILDITDIKRKDPNFANARELRNILDQVIMCQNLRCVGSDNKEIGLVDVNSYIQSEKINIPSASDSGKTTALSGEEELDKLIGLSQIKRMIKKIKAYAKKNHDSADFNMHMCFFGNPGTGKTEVARILSKILYEAGVLDEAKLVETDTHGLIGKFVGETAPKTKAKINKAMNGVLFIDEAYALCGSSNSNDGSNYADEAVSVLIKEMEDHRGQFCVILAGYKDETLELINSNPGFESRIQFKLDFPDYTRDELGEIAKKMLEKKHYDIAPDALNIMLDITDVLRAKPNFANARTVRNILDQVIMNQNLRTENFNIDNMLIIEQDVCDYIDDEGIDMNAIENKPKHSIGFI